MTHVIPFSADGGSSTTELQGTYGAAYIDGLMDYYNTFMPPFRNTSLASASGGRSSKPGGSMGRGGGVAVGGRSPCAAATEFTAGHQAVGLEAFGPPFKGLALLVFVVLTSICCLVC